MARGRVIKSTGSWYDVETGSGEIVRCRVRGKFRNQYIRSTNPVAVGDWVQWEGKEGESLITAIEERGNYIVRKSVNLSKESHIIASNLDQAILVATLVNPVTFPVFIDRFCVAAESFHIPVGLVFNKVDLLDHDGMDVLAGIAKVYRDIGYTVITTSVFTRQGLSQLVDVLKDKVSLLSGHSGVGKSSLINAIDPALTIRTGEISTAHQTGQHTTTFAEMHKLGIGGYIVDTPGIRGFGLVDLKREELAGYFPEMRKLLPECKFYNCLHLNEPGCAVKKALEAGEISDSRYHSYVNMFENDNDETYRT